MIKYAYIWHLAFGLWMLLRHGPQPLKKKSTNIYIYIYVYINTKILLLALKFIYLVSLSQKIYKLTIKSQKWIIEKSLYIYIDGELGMAIYI